MDINSPRFYIIVVIVTFMLFVSRRKQIPWPSLSLDSNDEIFRLRVKQRTALHYPSTRIEMTSRLLIKIIHERAELKENV
jgi:hypothetical protein